MTDHPIDDALVTAVADRWLEQLSRGEQPDAQQVAREHPELADIAAALLISVRGMWEAGRVDVATDPRDSRRVGPGEASSTVGSTAATYFSRPADHNGSALSQLGDYEIKRELGRGGMGIVFEAWHRSLRRSAAIKILPQWVVHDDVSLRRFQNEARAAATLDHPNIVDIYDVGCDAGLQYFAMRMIRGLTVREILDRLCGEGNDRVTNSWPCDDPSLRGTLLDTVATGTDAWYRSLAVAFRDAARALEHAHAHGIVHRDIKPSNLLIDVTGKLWVADFGLAACEANATLTGEGDLIGTPRYMSPEQASAGHRPVDHRSDIYSLGVTFFELLALRPAISGEDRGEILVRIGEHRLHSPRRHRDNVPWPLDAIVAKAAATEAKDRYAAAADLAADLQRYLDDVPVHARRAGPIRQAVYLTHRHRSVMLGSFVAMTLLLMIVGVSAVAIDRQRRRAIDSMEAARRAKYRESVLRRQAEERQKLADQLRRVSDRATWKASLAEATINLRDDAPGRRGRAVTAIRRAADRREMIDLSVDQIDRLEDLKLAAATLDDLALRHTFPLTKHAHQLEVIALTSDYRFYCQHRFREISVRETATDRQVGKVSLTDFPLSCHFSPDGTQLAIVGTDSDSRTQTLRIYDWKHDRQILHLTPGDLPGGIPRLAVDYHPDGSAIALATDSGRGQVVGLESSGEHEALTVSSVAEFDLPSPPHQLAYSPSGNEFAVTCVDAKRIQILAADGTLHDTIEVHETPFGLAWRQDERQLAVGVSYALTLFDRTDDGWRIGRQFHSQQAPVHEVDYHHGGAFLATHGYDGVSRIHRLGQREPMLRMDGHVTPFSENGRSIAVRGTQSIQIYDVLFGEHFWRVPPLPAHHGSPQRLSFLPGGRWLAIGMPHAIAFLDTETHHVHRIVDVGQIHQWTSCGDGSLIVCTDSAPLRMEARWTDGKEAGLLVRSEAVSPTLEGLEPVHATCSASTQRFVFASPSGVIHRYDADREHLVRLSSLRPVLSIALAPDGETFAASFVDESGFTIYRADDGTQLRHLETQRAGFVEYVQAGERTLLVADTAVACRIYDTAGFPILNRIARPGAIGGNAVAISADDETLAVHRSGRTLEVWDTEPLERRYEIGLPDRIGGPITAIGIGDRGDRIAAIADGAVYVWTFSGWGAL